MRRVIVAALVLVALSCNSKESFCTTYKESFLKSFTDVCSAKNGGQRDVCATQASEALKKDETWRAKCPAPGAASASASASN